MNSLKSLALIAFLFTVFVVPLKSHAEGTSVGGGGLGSSIADNGSGVSGGGLGSGKYMNPTMWNEATFANAGSSADIFTYAGIKPEERQAILTTLFERVTPPGFDDATLSEDNPLHVLIMPFLKGSEYLPNEAIFGRTTETRQVFEVMDMVMGRWNRQHGSITDLHIALYYEVLFNHVYHAGRYGGEMAMQAGLQMVLGQFQRDLDRYRGVQMMGNQECVFKFTTQFRSSSPESREEIERACGLTEMGIQLHPKINRI